MNLVSGRLVACYKDSCEIYQDGSWQHLQKTTVDRRSHSSATTESAVLLIGGSYSKSTEWIPVDGSAAYQGPFTIRHEENHCTIQISDDIIVVIIGGFGTAYYVTQYQLTDGTETPLTSLGQQRHEHACGVYKDIHDQQVRPYSYKHFTVINLCPIGCQPNNCFLLLLLRRTSLKRPYFHDKDNDRKTHKDKYKDKTFKRKV